MFIIMTGLFNDYLIGLFRIPFYTYCHYPILVSFLGLLMPLIDVVDFVLTIVNVALFMLFIRETRTILDNRPRHSWVHAVHQIVTLSGTGISEKKNAFNCPIFIF